MSENQRQANAQLIPIPPPVQKSRTTDFHLLQPSQAKNDTRPPLIELLTTSLIEGKNTFKVKITADKSYIKKAEINYVQNGKVITQELLKDPNNIYKALIDSRSPSAIIVINAVDINGKSASVVKELNVTSLADNIHRQILNLFFDVGKIIVSIFTSTKH
jgi:hypothetical protein